MPHPTPKVEIAFNASGTETWYENSPVWTDVTADVRSVSVSRGRSRDSERFGATNATVVLDNSSREYDPWNSLSSYWVPAVTERINLIKNSAFTQNLDYPAYGESHFWTTYGYGSAIALADDPIGNDGNNAYTFQGVGMSGFTTTADAAAVTVGQSYYGSMYVRQTNGTPLRVAQAQIVWYDSIGNILSTTSGATITLTAVFQRVSVNGAAPVSAATASLQLYFVDSWYADQYQVMYPLLEQSATLQPVFQRSDNAEGEWAYYAPAGFNGSVRYAVDGYSLLKPRLQLRITADAGSGYVPVWRGWISGFPVKYTKAGHNSTVTLDCYDGYAAIANYAIVPDMITNANVAVYWYRMQDAAGATTIASTTNKRPLVQVAGTTPITKFDSLIPSTDQQSVNLGNGNTWRSDGARLVEDGVVTTLPVYLGTGVRLWWAGNNPSVNSTLLVHRWSSTGANGELELTMLSTGYLRARYYTGASAYEEVTSTVNGLNTFVPHHLGVHRYNGELRIYVDGQNVSGAQTTGSGANPYSSIAGEQWLQLANDIFQDVSYRPYPSGTSWTTIVTTEALMYGLGAGKLRELSSERFTRLMDYAALDTYPQAFRYANAGAASSMYVTAIERGGALTPMLDKLVDSEGGTMFCDKDGVLRFYDQGYAFRKAAGAVSYALGDGVGDKPFMGDLEMTVSADDMENRVTVYFTGDGGVSATNQAAYDAYGDASREIETYLDSALSAAQLAQQRVAVFAGETTRISEIELSAATTSAQWDDILALDLLDKVSIAFAPLGGSEISKDVTIQEIRHEIRPKMWTTSIRCSERFVGHFTLDASSLDGTDTLL